MKNRIFEIYLIHHQNGNKYQALHTTRTTRLVFRAAKVAIMFILFAFILPSCQKDLGDKNSDEKSPTTSLDLRTPTLPTVQSGILKFSSRTELQDYFDYIETLSDTDLDTLEATLGFNSLRKYYHDEFDIDNDFQDGLPFYISDPYLSSVLNTYHEFWVGSDIYKYVEENIATKGPSTSVLDFIDMRDNGNEGILRSGLNVYDDYTNTEIFTDLRGRCAFTVVVDNLSNGEDVYVSLLGVDFNGNKVTGCTAEYTIDWGDGSTDDYYSGNVNLKRHHEYTLTSGSSQIFTITVEITTIFCSPCDDGSPVDYDATGSYHAHNNATCSPFEDSDDWIVDDIIYNSSSNRVIITQGYNLDDYLWHDARAWGRIEHFAKVNNKWKYSFPNFNLAADIHGTWYDDSCTGSSHPENKPRKLKKFNLFNQVKRDDHNMHLKSNVQLFCDFQTFHLSSTIALPDLPNQPFWPHP